MIVATPVGTSGITGIGMGVAFLQACPCRSSVEWATRVDPPARSLPMRRLCSCAAVLGVALSATTACGQAAPFNPYAEAAEALPPISADGTIHWGTFYKSSALQQSYERLWNLGACRGTNKAITVPVAENKLVIDRLPEAEFHGVVRAAAGHLAVGWLAFGEADADAMHAEPFVAHFHPAGVTRFTVSGRAPATILASGMVVRMRAEVNKQGRSKAPITAFEIVTPPAGFTPDEVRPDRIETIVGTVITFRKGVISLRVDAGKLRRLTLVLAEDAIATIDAARLDLVGPGDAIEAKGRLWTGEGAMGAGTVFVSDVLVTKRPLAERHPAAAPGSRAVGAR
jgi:hypothetical protein